MFLGVPGHWGVSRVILGRLGFGVGMEWWVLECISKIHKFQYTYLVLLGLFEFFGGGRTCKAVQLVVSKHWIGLVIARLLRVHAV